MRGTGLYGFHFSFREEDYPRVCGEQSPLFLYIPYTPGLPPRMRGIVHKNLSDHMERGITPAYAGNRLYGSIFKSSKLARMFPKIH